ncbi:hypothetical protein B0H34DRAFT_477464 [Crassisporium funariophilum]|nr:hypothetical protein B0H34DRAFT_477464 [Crassisporium funariophilum]
MSFSVPTSPVMSRSTKAQPTTPQRLPRHQPRSQSFYRSPLTPSTSPYTPLSLRSFDSTGSSTLTTPDNIGMNVKKRLTFASVSPEVVHDASATKDKSLADIAENWRSRANENGIKVSYANEGSHFVADDSSDMSMSDVANDSSIISTEEALLAAPFLSTHRRLNSLPVSSRPRAQSHAPLPTSRSQPMSPIVTRNSRAPQQSSPQNSRRALSSYNNSNLMSTPPPNRILAKQYKLKGSFTDPAQPRRREAFGVVPTPSQNIHHRNASMCLTLGPDTSLDLFDIDENDFEYEHDFQDSHIEDSFSRSLHARTGNNFGYPNFNQPQQQAQRQVYPNENFADPFQPVGAVNGLSNGHVLSSIAESVEHHFHASRQQQPQAQYYEDHQQPARGFYAPSARLRPQYNQGMPQAYPAPTYVPVPQPSVMPFHTPPMHHKAVAERSYSSSIDNHTAPCLLDSAPSTDCSVCLASHPDTLAILLPCSHPLCSACLTSALNIVGEKDMQCAVCKQGVADFKLVIGSSKASSGSKPPATKGEREKAGAPVARDQSDTVGRSFMDPMFSGSPVSSDPFEQEIGNDSAEGLESAFEFGLDFGELRASTPKLERQMQDTSTEGASRTSVSMNSAKREVKRGEENVVLRIDNVPWDITPTQITRWLQQPVERVHVLLDGKGKTLSHAYVEVKNAPTAGAILRGEAQSTGFSGKKERSSVLGRGRRARGVTVTRSGQQELMSDLFPHWRGSFDGCRPSLAGLEGDRIIGALEGGLLTENEISGLMHLIREPDSHFLKVPSLPFHSLISLLSKFPADVDSRVFWSASVRDMLFDATYIAIQILLTRVEKVRENSGTSVGHQDSEFTMDLVHDLLHSALDCRAFTSHQIHRLVDLAQARSLPLPERNVSPLSDYSDFGSRSGSSAPRTPGSARGSDPSMAFFGQNVLNSSHARNDTDGSLQDLAKEFGVDAHVVQALAQRLARLC